MRYKRYYSIFLIITLKLLLSFVVAANHVDLFLSTPHLFLIICNQI